ITWMILRIAILCLSILVAGKGLRFMGVLIGYALAELAGMLFMHHSLVRALGYSSHRLLIPDTIRLSIGTFVIIAACIVVGRITNQWETPERISAIIQLGAVFLTFLGLGTIFLILTDYLSLEERRAILGILSSSYSKS
ncbi:MAG: hypothetical protein ACFFCW_27210, partial [Candidatus Hodarchaeota archaeon]